MANIDRALNIYQSYSLAKISSLNKKTLAMQYAQCGEINKLEKSISRELQAVNKLNKQILENQLKEIKHKEQIKFYRKIAFDAKEAIEIMDSQDNLMFKCFLCEIYAKPLGLLLEDAKNNLEEISDKEYCSIWNKKLESCIQTLNTLYDQFHKSAYHDIISERDSFEKEKYEIDKKREELENKRSGLIPPEQKPLIEIKKPEGLAGGCLVLSILFLIFGLIVFFVNWGETDDALSLGLVWVAFPIVLIMVAFLIEKIALKKEKKEYPFKLKNTKKENEIITKENNENQKEFIDKLKAIDQELQNLKEEKNSIISNHPYSIALVQINQDNPNWQSVIEEIERYLPKEEEDKEEESEDPLYNEIKNYVIESGVASISNIQRKYTLGYKRAGKIMDKLEAEGIIGSSKR